MNKLAMLGDHSQKACGIRLNAARRSTGMSKSEFCKEAGLTTNALRNQVKGLVFPANHLMIYLYRSFQIDPIFILHGDFMQLPRAIQDRIFEELPASHDELKNT